jgi:hypothetical protein
LSKNYGVTWNQINDGLSSSAYYVLSLGANGQFIFDGTSAASIWRRPLSQLITGTTGVADKPTAQPQRFSLEQNYPNPFNPSTNISFSIPTQSFVSLKVFDLIGREVATLVSEQMSAGSHSKQWNANGITSGIYFYQLKSDKFTETKKLVLLK